MRVSKPWRNQAHHSNMEAMAIAAETAGEVAEPESGALLDRARAGDSRAFESLYRTHVGRVYAVCLRLAGDVRLAEECTQDAFVQAWEKLASFRGDSAFGTWLHRIAVNMVLGRHRKRKRWAAWLVEDEEAALAQADRAAGPDGLLDLDQALRQLPSGAREVFVLHDVEGYGHEEIAGLMGIAAGTSKAQLHRARKLLQARLSA